jgi:ABC-2 type transport system permease protein
MVRVLIALRGAMARNQFARGSAWALWVLIAFGVASAVGTLLLGVVHGPQVTGSLDRVSAVLLLWLGGQLAMGALNGDAALPPELLAPLPLGRRRLAWALLVVGLCDPALVLVALAYAAVIAVAAGLGPGAVIVAVAGVAGLLVLTSVGVTLAAGTLGPGSRRGRDLGTVVVALAISFLAVAATLLPALLSGLQAGRWRAFAWVVRIVPSGWPGDAVMAAHQGRWALTAVALAAPLVLAALLALAWPAVLTRRMSGTASSSHRAGGGGGGRRLLPATPVGAVTAKEFKLWLRDPVRFTCLLIALIVGVGVGLIPRLATGTAQLLPFSGPLTVVIIGACATNLYGNDGTSLWLTIAAPRSAVADVRGRQLAWLLLVAPVAVAETLVLTAWSGQHGLWPWALGLLIALLGGAAGLAPLASLVSVQPLDDTGSPTPLWSLKVHVALVAVALTAAPAVALLAVGSASHNSALSWAGVAVAAATAAACAALMGAAAARRLQARQLDVLRLLAA